MKLLTKIVGLISVAYLSCAFAGTASTGGGPASVTVTPTSTTAEVEINHSEFVRMENRMRATGNASVPTDQGRLDVQEISREFFTIEPEPRRITPNRPVGRSFRMLP